MELSVLALYGAAAVVTVFRGPERPGWMVVCWVGYAVMLLLLSANVWSEDWAFMRASYEFYLVSVALVVRRPLRGWVRWTVLWGMAVWAATAMHAVGRT